MSSGAAHAVLAASAARAASTPVRVSGLGFITPIGRTVEAFDDALFAGRSAVGMAELPFNIPVEIEGEVEFAA